MEDDEVIADVSLHRPRQHAAHLAPLVESLHRHAEWQMRDLDVIAVSSGPGSYTGLRIGVSTAKGFAMATSAAIVAVPTLEAFAMRAASRASAGDVVMPLFDARRESVYAGAWRVRADGSLDCLFGAEVLGVADVRSRVHGFETTVHLLGNGIRVLEEAGTRSMNAHSHVDLSPHAAAVARLGKQLFDDSVFADMASFEPDYLREFVAKTPARSAFAKLGF